MLRADFCASAARPRAHGSVYSRPDRM